MKKLLLMLLAATGLCRAAYLIPADTANLVRPLECQDPIVFTIRDTPIEFGNDWMSRVAFKDNKHLTGEVPDQTPPDDLSFSINDYFGKNIGAGELELQADGSYVLTPFWTENGYYEIVLPGFEGQAIGILVMPKNQAPTDEFFAIDACFTNFYQYFTPAREHSFASILDYCGIRKIRDRLKWWLLQPNGRYEMNKKMGKYEGEAHRKIAKEHNLDFLDVFHDTPSWLRTTTRHSDYPDNLLASAESWQVIAKEYSQYWDTLEVWNEIDLGRDKFPADQYGSFLKAISIGLQQAGLDVKLASCVYASLSDGHWQNKVPAAVANGVLENSDFFAYHNYEPIDSIEKNTGYFRNYLEGNPRQGIPIYMTEVGEAWDGMDKDRPVLNDELHSATSITGKAIEGKAVGIARFYAFILSSYDEINKNFGLFDRHHTPLRIFASYANACNLLSGWEYIGDVAEMGRAFSKADEGDAIVTVVCKQNKFKAIPRWLLTKDATLIGPDGKILSKGLNKDTQLGSEAGDSIYFIRVPRKHIAKHLNANTEAMRLLNIARNYQPQPRIFKPGIIQHHINDSNNRNWSLRGYYFYDLTRVEFELYFNNLSDTPITFRPAVHLPEDAVLLQDLPKEITVAPMSRQSAIIALNLTDTFQRGIPCSLRITDDAKNADGVDIKLNAAHWKNKAYANHGIDWNIADKLTDKFQEIQASGIDTSKEFAPLFDGIYFGGKQNWDQEEGGPDPDIEAQFMTNYNSDTLQVIVQVRDDNKFIQNMPAHEMWRRDSLQVCLQTGRADNRNTELTISEFNGKPMIYAHFTQYYVGDSFYHGQPIEPTEAQILHLDEHNYVYIANIDLRKLDQDGITPGSDFSFCLLVNSSEGNIRSGYLKWGDGIGRFKDNGYFNQLILLP